MVLEEQSGGAKEVAGEFKPGCEGIEQTKTSKSRINAVLVRRNNKNARNMYIESKKIYKALGQPWTNRKTEHKR